MSYSRTFLKVLKLFTAVSNLLGKEEGLVDYFNIADQLYVYRDSEDPTVALFTEKLKGLNPSFLNAIGFSYSKFCEYFTLAFEDELVIAGSFFDVSDRNQLLFSTINWKHPDIRQFPYKSKSLERSKIKILFELFKRTDFFQEVNLLALKESAAKALAYEGSEEISFSMEIDGYYKHALYNIDYSEWSIEANNEFWSSMRSERFPRLRATYQLLKDIPCSNAALESTFSLANNVIGSRRVNLGDEKLSKLMCIPSFVNSIPELQNMERQFRFAIEDEDDEYSRVEIEDMSEDETIYC
ncbi:hypothetical protein OGAPHI_004009 [Ogataea philodendri]|uniref:HAT C-terminal dimerisation domain-containing protein n=1 Tax=Ogataea philodendri TaxID=1378263 RepID=A0A9P8T4K6_9ASCO|nr:uncharacterized protein OGAPHI_004009 [Ogataea philodendri]KAH3665821.1 hypothetical protein OGAPHI_004009 [Ogataea philodendri]